MAVSNQFVVQSKNHKKVDVPLHLTSYNKITANTFHFQHFSLSNQVYIFKSNIRLKVWIYISKIFVFLHHQFIYNFNPFSK
jgi:hypothetical protein